MRIGGSRRDNKTGALAVLFTTKSSPYLGGFRFDSSQSGASPGPWVERYSLLPVQYPSITNGYDYGSDIAVSPENTRVIVGGQGSTNLQIYAYDLNDGFTGKTVRTSDPLYPTEFTNVNGVAFSADGKTLAISSDDYVSAYSWSGEAITSRNFISSAPTNSTAAGVNFWPYDSYPRVGDDEMIAASFRGSVFNDHYVRTYNISSASIIDTQTYAPNNTTSSSGYLRYPPQISPRLVGSPSYRVGFAWGSLDTINAYQVNDGVFGAYHLAPGSPGQTNADKVTYAMFDPHGRMILGLDVSPWIEIWTQSSSAGTYTRLSDAASDGITWTGGEINSMAYDKDQDILFLAHQSSPYISAIKMTSQGFGDLYNSPAAIDIPSSAVVRMSLVYDEKWKTYNA